MNEIEAPSFPAVPAAPFGAMADGDTGVCLPQVRNYQSDIDDAGAARAALERRHQPATSTDRSDDDSNDDHGRAGNGHAAAQPTN